MSGEDENVSRQLSIYGTIAYSSQYQAQTVLLISLFLVLSGLEICFRKLEKLAEKHKLIKLYEKLKQELMTLGIISFLIFIITQSAPDFASSASSYNWYLAFEVAHIIILFIALAFIVQACFLIRYAFHMQTTFFLFVRKKAVDVKVEYDEMIAEATNTDGSFKSFTRLYFFDKMPYYLPSFSSYRDTVDFKVVEKLFLRNHPVPNEFDFSKYVSYLFQDYIAELGEVSSYNWVILAILVAINQAKVAIFDAYRMEEVCGSTHRKLGGGATESICYNYILQYALIMSVLMCVFTCTVSYFTSLYYKKMTDLAFSQIVPEYNKIGIRATLYTKALKLLMKAEQEEQAPDFNRKLALEQYESERRSRHYEKLHKRELLKKGSIVNDHFFGRLKHYLHFKLVDNGVLSGESDHEHIQNEEIYLFKDPFLFFQIVELTLLIQCFYIAVFLTQMVPIAQNTSEAGAWIVFMCLPIFINFFLIESMLSKVVLLHATTILEESIVAHVCQDTIEQDNILSTLRNKIHRQLPSSVNTPIKMFEFIQVIFEEIDKDKSGSIEQSEFRSFLGRMNVYLTKSHFEICWHKIDYDLSGGISFDEIFSFIFPGLRDTLKQNLTTASLIREAFYVRCEQKGLPETAWRNEWEETFNGIDKDGNGFIDSDEFKVLLVELDLEDKINAKNFNVILSALETSEQAGMITYHETLGLIFPNLDSQDIIDKKAADVANYIVEIDEETGVSRMKKNNNRSPISSDKNKNETIEVLVKADDEDIELTGFD